MIRFGNNRDSKKGGRFCCIGMHANVVLIKCNSFSSINEINRIDRIDKFNSKIGKMKISVSRKSFSTA